MRHNRWLVGFIEVAVVLVVCTLIAGQLLGQPVLLSYVTSGSMEPTMEPGDGFVAVPPALSGPIGEGDVVVFRAKTVNEGELTTHRVVGQTQRGFITRGDANPSTDQASGEPPLKRPRIEATGLQVSGTLVVIPHLGDLVTGASSIVLTARDHLRSVVNVGSLLGTTGFAYLVFALSILVYAVDAVRDTRETTQSPTRSRNDGHDTMLFIGIMVLFVVVMATAAMVGPAGPFEFEVVSSATDAPGPGVIEAGGVENATYVMHNDGFVPVLVMLAPASDGIDVSPSEHTIEAQDTANATVRITAPEQHGYYRKYIVEHRYLAILPTATIRSLYEVHPWLPIVAVDAVVAIVLLVAGRLLLGTGRMRMQPQRELPLNVSLRRWFRELYR